MIKVKDIFIFIFCITNINMYAQSSEDHCNLWRKQKDTITSSNIQLKHNHDMISKVDELCKMEIYLKSAHLLYLSLQKTDSSLYLYDKVIKLAINFKQEDFLIEAYTNKALILTQIMKNEEAVVLLKKSKKILKNRPLSKSWAVYYEAMAEISDNNSEYNKAIKYADSMTEISIKLKDTFNLFSSYHNKGIYNFRISDYEQAVVNLLEALNLQEVNNKLVGKARTNYLLGFSYLKWEYFETAKKYLKKSIEEAQQKQDDFTLMLSYPYLAECYRKLDENDKALENINIAIRLSEKSNNNNRIARSYVEKGWLYLNNFKQYNKSEQYFNKAYSFAKRSNDDFYLYLSLQGLLELYLKKKQYKTIQKYLPNFKEIVERRKILLNTKEFHKISAEYYENTGQSKFALTHLKEYYKIKDSISNTEVKNQVADLEKKYDTKKKELQIVRLNQQKEEQEQIALQAKNRQYLYLIIATFLLTLLGIGGWAFRKLRKQRKELVSTNQVKNRLFSIIAHDLRGMIIPFQRSGKILKYHIQKENYDKTIELSKALDQNSERLSNMLDNLLNWSLEQMNGYKINPEKITVGKELKDIISGYEQQASYKNTKLELIYENELLIDFDKGAFHVIFRNLINNALKYTENGSIRIEFATKDNVFLCSVIDTGIGMSSDQLTHLFALEERKSTIGTQGEKGTGLGLNLVYGFIKMHKGTITVSSEKRIGTRFDLSVPTTLTLIENDSAATEPLSA